MESLRPLPRHTRRAAREMSLGPQADQRKPAPNTIEETYELCDALIRDDKNDICKELGDVLLHVAFYAKIGSETGDFDMKDVCDPSL